MKSNLNPSSSQSARPEEFDLVILGGGTGSTVAAWTFAGDQARRLHDSHVGHPTGIRTQPIQAVSVSLD